MLVHTKRVRQNQWREKGKKQNAGRSRRQLSVNSRTGAGRGGLRKQETDKTRARVFLIGRLGFDELWSRVRNKLLRTYIRKRRCMTEKVKLDVFWADSESKFLQNAVQAAIKVYRECSIAGVRDESRPKASTFAALSRDDT